ncbi:MAG TPA: putative metal-dependent hydrolase, partial [Bacteroidia bacterium]|nr:putative metal-dependent hydrolase [Bacteroidia bacterium]
MTTPAIDTLRFPIGKWEKPAKMNLTKIKKQISIIKKFPNVLKKDVSALSESQLDTAYRPDGWTGRQVVHHLADSHMNAFCRFKLTLTEDHPTIKPYIEAKWAELEDAKTADVKLSIQLLNGLHKRWV